LDGLDGRLFGGESLVAASRTSVSIPASRLSICFWSRMPSRTRKRANFEIGFAARFFFAFVGGLVEFFVVDSEWNRGA